MNYKIIGKYIKNLNFNIPNPKTFFLLSKDIAHYKINIDIKSDRIKQNIIEIMTSINLTTTQDNIEKITTDITHSTIVELSEKKIEKEELEKIILVDVPSEIYGELREVFVNLFESSGFKDIKISKEIDFQKLHSSRKIQ